MDRATESDIPNCKGLKVWSVKGDLNTLATDDRFSLYNSITYYSSNKNYSLNDILENFMDQNKKCSVIVFDNKTQGEAYHIYVLAIAAFIESRFPKAALVGGNITKENYNFILAVLMLKNDWHTRSIQKDILELDKLTK